MAGMQELEGLLSSILMGYSSALGFAITTKIIACSFARSISASLSLTMFAVLFFLIINAVYRFF
jgi:hypothetical protein